LCPEFWKNESSSPGFALEGLQIEPSTRVTAKGARLVQERNMKDELQEV
jgi:hypothetical protein